MRFEYSEAEERLEKTEARVEELEDVLTEIAMGVTREHKASPLGLWESMARHYVALAMEALGVDSVGVGEGKEDCNEREAAQRSAGPSAEVRQDLRGSDRFGGRPDAGGRGRGGSGPGPSSVDVRQKPASVGDDGQQGEDVLGHRPSDPVRCSGYVNTHNPVSAVQCGDVEGHEGAHRFPCAGEWDPRTTEGERARLPLPNAPWSPVVGPRTTEARPSDDGGWNDATAANLLRSDDTWKALYPTPAEQKAWHDGYGIGYALGTIEGGDSARELNSAPEDKKSDV